MTKRIALISEHATPLGIFGGVDSGGQNVYVGQLAKHLAAIGYHVDVFTRRDADHLPEVVDWQQGVRVIHVPAGPAVAMPKEKLLPYMNEFTAFMVDWCHSQTSYDLVHANFWMSALVAADMKRVLGIPFVVTFHALGRVRRLYQGDADQFPDDRFAVEDRVVQEADHIIAECPQDREDLLNLYHAHPSRIGIIPCGFDPLEFWAIDKTRARLTLGLPPDEALILQLGRMVPRKGVDNVIRAFAQLQKKQLQKAQLQQEQPVAARLIIVGGEAETPDPQLTPEIGRLNTIAQELGVATRISFVGRRGREVLKYYYSAADVFVTTPWYEPFGITPIEAMACGTPVIGANVGGVKFTVKDGETGYLVPPNEPEALADRLQHLLGNPQLRNLFGRQAIRRSQEHFTWQKVTSAVAALYEEVLSGVSTVAGIEANQMAILDHGFETVIKAVQRSQRLLRPTIQAASQAMSNCFLRGGKLLICGNGGSAADAQHLAAELVGRFCCPHRAGLPAMALTADTAFVTAWANDVSYDNIFARQVETFAQPHDLLIGISTSGRSKNVIAAFEAARRANLTTIALLGGEGGELRHLADIAIVVPAIETQRIQEVQLMVMHLLCELIEEQLLAAAPNETARLGQWETPQYERTMASVEGMGLKAGGVRG
ncbi:glycosyltransferase [Leptolyngbya sp. FACHB-711]|uniref:glycosyltransferase n=1 Tax=unclassified Leptolyngbya TaxID=2650499 RepID=UPI00168446B1|nr:glycosyltransferase [Leptolyngbya sp. FACHB-711]MBD1848790.1 glycosyltransferase [Cyanobacteria bacterium FACHB-502]MBD2027135.1 glycosyltransferase [Leptolyngbya sp. FACHB-711]